MIDSTLPCLAALVVALAGEPVHVPLRDAITVERPGASAAFSLDPSVADASASSGRLTIRGRYPGRTTVTVVTLAAVESLVVVVDPAPAPRRDGADGDPRGRTVLDSRYDSATDRVASGLDLTSRGGERFARLNLLNVTRAGGNATGDVVLLDQLVEHTQLSLDGATLRGVHLRTPSVELHAGWSSPLLYRSVLLSDEREAAFGGSFRVPIVHGFSLSPVVYHFPYDSLGGTRGTMGSLALDAGEREDPIRLRAELGYGGAPGGALRLDAGDGANRLWIDARHQPRDFASVGQGRPRGSSADGSSTTALGSRLALNVTTSFAHHELPLFDQRSANAHAELRAQLGRGWSTWSGGSAARHSTASTTVRSLTVPLGVAWDASVAGGSVVYRYGRNTARNGGSHGGRLALRAGGATLRATTFGDFQQDAATVDLVFREVPELAAALAELGLTARTPEDLSRILRDEPALAALGVLRGASLELHPWRAQAGLEVSAASRHRRDVLRLQLLADRTRAVARVDETFLATATYTRRIAAGLDLLGGGTWWSRAGAHATSWQAGFRARLDGAPRIPSFGPRDRIRGMVFRDVEGAGFEGARVRLDGGREVVTGADGRFEFDRAGDGEHRVEVILPDADRAFFTTRSSARTRGGDELSFGVASAPSRLRGRVRDDAGAGIPGVVVHLAREGWRGSATTDSTGGYAFTVAEGTYALEIDGGTVPPGHELDAAAARRVELTRARRVWEDHSFAATRSVSGKVRASGATNVVVQLVEAGREARTDGDGRYVFRRVAPGSYTVVANVDGRRVSRTIEVPAGPALLRGVDLE
jgi:hypothetical protein